MRRAHAQQPEQGTVRISVCGPKQRKRFAEIVNAVMTKAGSQVRYDERSYKDMGINVEAMKSVKKMIEDKVRSASACASTPS